VITRFPVYPKQQSWPISFRVLKKYTNEKQARNTPHNIHAGAAGGGGRLEVTVSEPIKHNEGALQAYIAFKVSTSTDRPEFQQKTTSVIRRYTDFVWAHNRLQATYPVRWLACTARQRVRA
jgi:hypothetical protein